MWLHGKVGTISQSHSWNLFYSIFIIKTIDIALTIKAYPETEFLNKTHVNTVRHLGRLTTEE